MSPVCDKIIVIFLSYCINRHLEESFYDDRSVTFVLKCDYISDPAGIRCVGFVYAAVETLCTQSPPNKQKGEDREEGKGLAEKTSGIHEALHGPLCSRLLFCGCFFIR